MSKLKIKEAKEKAFDIFGGRENFFYELRKQINEFDNIWNQDSEKIGRVLRAHLVVEHFLTAHIEIVNPNLAPLDNARISFAQKIELLNEHDHIALPLKPGLKRLNSIRNRVAHKLSVDVGSEDRDVFLSVYIFKAMRKASSDGQKILSNDPLVVMEEFALFAARLLQPNSNRDLWDKAIEVWSQCDELFQKETE